MKQPDKSLGQHWLEDELFLNEIVHFAEVDKDDTVLEIGPGPGFLTEKLTKKAKQVIAVEIDPHWADYLINLNIDNLKVVNQDIREFNFEKIGNYKVIANIPYYITNYITSLLIDAKNPPSSFTLLMQKEVAERMADKPGDMSLLSIAVQLFGQVSLGVEIGKQWFNPEPKVDSRVVRVDKRDSDYDKSAIMKLARAGFANKRKKLSNSLSGSLQIDKETAEIILKESGLEKKVRAQELSLDDWQKLSEVYDVAV